MRIRNLGGYRPTFLPAQAGLKNVYWDFYLTLLIGDLLHTFWSNYQKSEEYALPISYAKSSTVAMAFCIFLSNLSGI